MIIINDKKDCTGCSACASVCPKSCISMKNDYEGFWYPEVSIDECIKCELCIKVCPIINKEFVQSNPIAYACINKNENIRMESSSGGVFTLIAEQVVHDGGVVLEQNLNLILQLDIIMLNQKKTLENFVALNMFRA